MFFSLSSPTKPLRLFCGVVLNARLFQKKSVMAHPPSGSAQKERIRFALYCAVVILRAFFVKVHSSFPVGSGERGKPLPARSRYSQSNFILTMAVMSLISKWRFMYSSTQ